MQNKVELNKQEVRLFQNLMDQIPNKSVSELRLYLSACFFYNAHK
jgi:hypothetical protein